MHYNGNTYALAFDQAGALLAVADNMGNAIQQNKIDCFGNMLASVGLGMCIPLSYGGGLLDADTGLAHF